MKPQAALRNAKPANFPTLMFTGIASSMLVIAAYKFMVKPRLLRNRLEEAEQCASFLMDDQNPTNNNKTEFDSE